MGVLHPFESSSRWLVVGMASGEDDGCLRIISNWMMVVVVEDGGDVIKGVDGIVCCCHTFIRVFLDIGCEYVECP